MGALLARGAPCARTDPRVSRRSGAPCAAPDSTEGSAVHRRAIFAPALHGPGHATVWRSTRCHRTHISLTQCNVTRSVLMCRRTHALWAAASRVMATGWPQAGDGNGDVQATPYRASSVGPRE